VRVGDRRVHHQRVTDAHGRPAVGVLAEGQLLADHFFPVAERRAITDAVGRVRFVFEAAEARAGDGDRWVHVTAGAEHPLVEIVVAV
jgi:hypothetical protein